MAQLQRCVLLWFLLLKENSLCCFLSLGMLVFIHTASLTRRLDGLSYNASTGHSLSSISESANAYYSLALFAAMYGQTDLASFGRLLSATELAAAKKYWFTLGGTYAPEFAANKLVSHVSAIRVTASPRVVHSLARHMRPLSSITAQLFSAEIVQGMMPELSASITESLPPYASAYRSFFHLASALLNPTTAFESIAALPLLDATETRTHALYWCATRSASSSEVSTPASAKPTWFYLRVQFSNDASASHADSNIDFDSGTPYTKSRGFGWTGATPTLAVHPLAASFGSNFATLAIVPAGGEWRVDLPAAGDYTVRLALAPG